MLVRGTTCTITKGESPAVPDRERSESYALCPKATGQTGCRRVCICIKCSPNAVQGAGRDFSQGDSCYGMVEVALLDISVYMLLGSV